MNPEVQKKNKKQKHGKNRFGKDLFDKMLANLIGNISHFSRFTYSLSSVIPLFNVDTEFHWIKMSKKQRQNCVYSDMLWKNVRTPT